MSYNSEVKRDCIFYEEYQDMVERCVFIKALTSEFGDKEES